MDAVGYTVTNNLAQIPANGLTFPNRLDGQNAKYRY